MNDQVGRRRDKLESLYRELYIRYVQSVLSPEVQRKVEARLADGDIEGALAVLDDRLTEYANVIPTTVQQAADAEFNALGAVIGASLLLDITSIDLIRIMRDNREGFSARIREAQSRALRQAYTDGILRDVSTTRSVFDSVGLSERQQAAVSNYRDMLNRQNGTAGPSERRTPAEINRMVRAYRDRLIDVRADQVARATATRVASQAQELAIAAAVAEGVLDESRTVRVWNRIPDDRVRDAHNVMQGQTSPIGGVFEDGNGNKLRYPGDPLAPIETTINCRCTLTLRNV
jgi:hypothetical protein